MAEEEIMPTGDDQEEEQEKGIFKTTLDMIRRNKHGKDSGMYNSIPFGIASLDRHVPGIVKGFQYIITASSGIGKTQLTKFLFVNQPYKFVKDHPELGIKLKVLYFALEESREEFMLTLISNRLKDVYGIDVSVMELRSMGEHTLSNEVLERVEACADYFKELEESIEVVDSVSNPYGIYKYIRSYSEENGVHYNKVRKFKYKAKDGSIVEKNEEVYSHYEANNPNEFVIVIVDHLGLLGVEKGKDADTLHGAMGKFSAEYGRKNITKHYKYCLVLVQQQAADKEKQQFTHSGQSIESKLEPSLDGLGDNKLTQRDALIVLGLFAPERYGIEKHLGYDIKVLKDNYRCLSILKNRIGTPNLKLPLFFNGLTNTFAQLPLPGHQDLEKLYAMMKLKGQEKK